MRANQTWYEIDCVVRILQGLFIVIEESREKSKPTVGGDPYHTVKLKLSGVLGYVHLHGYEPRPALMHNRLAAVAKQVGLTLDHFRDCVIPA
jgi:hypothetical protein